MDVATPGGTAYARLTGSRGESLRPVVEPPERRKVGRHPPDGSAVQHEFKHLRPVPRNRPIGPAVSVPPERPHLDCPDLRDRMTGGDLDRFLEAAALDDVEAADDLLRFRERPVGDELLAVADADGLCAAGRREPGACHPHPAALPGAKPRAPPILS